MKNTDTAYHRLAQMLRDSRLALTTSDPAACLAALEVVREALHHEERCATAALYEASLSAVLCCQCGARIPADAANQRLKLCMLHMGYGLLAYCVHCGENYPEHHGDGKGCTAWERMSHTETPEERMQTKQRISPHAPCQAMGKKLDTALASLAVLLDGHAPSCVCCHCQALAQGQAAMDGIGLLCTIVDTHARLEWETQTPGPFAEISNACLDEAS